VSATLEAAACTGLANLMIVQFDPGAAVYVERAYQLQRELRDLKGAAHSEWNFGRIALNAEGPGRKAHRFFEKSLQTATRTGDARGMANAHVVLGIVYEVADDDVAAGTHWEEAVRLYEGLGPDRGHAIALCHLAGLAIRKGQYERARERLTASIQMLLAQRHGEGTARALEAFARLAVAEGYPVRTLELAGAAHTLREMLGAPVMRHHGQALERAVDRARGDLAPKPADEAWNRGSHLGMDDAIDLALSRYV
jgi:hypothetical protein